MHALLIAEHINQGAKVTIMNLIAELWNVVSHAIST